MSPIKNRKKILGWGWIALGFKVSSHQPAARSTISGRITGAKYEEPLIGATIMRKGTAKGTGSDLSGEFSIIFPTNATLVFPYKECLKKETGLIPYSSPALTAEK